MNDASPEPSIPALKAGDRDEFVRMVEIYSGRIYRLALRMLGNPADAEDVLQNTFMKALQHIHSFEGRSSLSTWLHRIAANEALMILRKQHPETALEETENEDIEQVQIVDWCCLPESELLDGEAKQALDKAIQKLPEPLRIVFLLRDIEGMSIQETCEALHLSETAVKTRLLRARLKLRDKLSVYYSERLNQRKTQDA